MTRETAFWLLASYLADEDLHEFVDRASMILDCVYATKDQPAPVIELFTEEGPGGPASIVIAAECVDNIPIVEKLVAASAEFIDIPVISFRQPLTDEEIDTFKLTTSSIDEFCKPAESDMISFADLRGRVLGTVPDGRLRIGLVVPGEQDNINVLVRPLLHHLVGEVTAFMAVGSVQAVKADTSDSMDVRALRDFIQERANACC